MTKDFIQVRHSSIIIPNYTLGDCEKLERLLSVWNETYFRLDPIGYHYNEETREMRIPRGVDLGYIEKLLNRPYEMDYKADEHEKSIFKLKVEPRSDIQRKSISFLTGLGKYNYTALHSQLTLNLDTGDGKTYCAIAAASFLETKAIIITHTDNVKQQWIKSMVDMTNLDIRHILNIEGSAMIKKIMKIGKLPHKVFLINHRTIYSYAKKHGWEAVTALFKHLKVGLKIYDEAHLEFSNLIRTDLYTNTKKTIYLTATFTRSHRTENKVFEFSFKNIAKYGRETRAEKQRHIVYMPVMFNSKPDMMERGSIRNRHGLDKNKYIDYQMSKAVLTNVVEWLLNYLNKYDGRMLILMSKIDAADAMHEFVKDLLPDKSVSVYHSKIDPKEKIKALEADIIVSTPKSLGTGTDIKQLRFVIMTEPYTSSITAEQSSGRLRVYSETEATFHIELVDRGFPDVVRMYQKRLPVFKKKCSTIVVMNHDAK